MRGFGWTLAIPRVEGGGRSENKKKRREDFNGVDENIGIENALGKHLPGVGWITAAVGVAAGSALTMDVELNCIGIFAFSCPF